MSKTEILLSTLRDIQEPAAPESVSLWLLLGNIVLIAALLLLYQIRRQRRRDAWRRQARREIHQAKSSEADKVVVKLAKLLRKIAIHRNNLNSHLQGDKWLKELDNMFSTQWFTQGEGKIFGTALYQKTTLQAEEIDTLSRTILTLVNALPAESNPSITRS